MKKIFLTLFIISLMGLGEMYAQKIDSYGLRGSLDLATGYGKDAKGSKSMPALHLGFFGDIAINKTLFARGEVNYALKGSKFYNKETKESSKTLMHYIEVPITLQYRIAFKNKPLYVGAGPFVAFALAGSEAGESMEFGGDAGNSRFDMGVKIYAGYELTKTWGVGLESNIGLKGVAEEVKAYSLTYGIFFTYKF